MKFKTGNVDVALKRQELKRSGSSGLQKQLQWCSVAKGYTSLFRGIDQHLSKQKTVESKNEMREGTFCPNVPAGYHDMMDHPEEEQSVFILTFFLSLSSH